MKEKVKEKRVLFITTKNLDYLRNTQEIELLKEYGNSVTVLGFGDKSYVKRLLKVYFGLFFMSMKEYDLIFIGFAPQLILPLFAWKFHNKEVVMDFFISVYDTMACDRKKFSPESIPGKLCKWLDTKCIGQADLVICDTNAHGDYFAKEFQKDRDQIQTLYLKADTSIYYPREVAKPETLKDRFIVLYFGSVLPLQGIEVIQEAMDLLKNEKDLYFYFIGPLKDGMEKVESPYVEYIPWLSQEELAEYIAMSDLCLAGHFHPSINKAKRTIPGKAYIYQAMGKPMILGDNPATRELYAPGDGIYFVEMGNAKALADTILAIAQNK